MTNPTSSRNWKKRTGGHELRLPSDNVCLVKRPGMQKLLAMGIMPDSLTPIAMKHLAAAESGGRPVKDGDDSSIEQELLEQVIGDPAKINELMQTFDKVVAECVVEPKVRVHWYTEKDELTGHIPDGYKVGDDIPDDEDHRGDPEDEDTPLYTDDVDDDDKQFIFQYVVGGSSDLERFRQESAAALASAQPGQDVPGSAE
jgi:hypothetical protein